MRILFLTHNYPPERNAAATRVSERAAYWTRWGHEVTVITCAPNFPDGVLFDGYANRWRQVEEIDGIRVVRVKSYITPNKGAARRLLAFLSYMAAAFLFALFERRPDVVVATSPQFFTAVAGWGVGAVRRIPFVFELGDLWPASITAVGAMKPSFFLRLMEKVELFLYHRSACVAALTDSFKDDLVGRGIPAAKIAVVINGVDLPRYAPRPKDAALEREWGLAGKFMVGYIGTHGMAHALGNVLDAAERLRGRDDIRFMLVGAGAEREGLVADAKRRGLTNVLFVPAQPKEAMPRWWSLCDAALVHLKDAPVFAGVIPSKIFEAMGMGLPILFAGPAGEGSVIVEREGAGVVVPAEAPQALADATIRMADDRTALATMAAKSHEAAPRYSRETQAKAMIDVMTAVVEGRGDRVAP